LIINDLDIGSLYPSISKSLNLYPNHLGESFNKQYSQFIDVRLAEKHKPKAERNNALIEGYKLLLNGAYGKSGEETSFLYDPLYTYKTTIAGQLFICMWAERMVEKVPELEFIQINTDGITIRLPKEKVDLIREVYLQLEKETGLSTEEAFYNQMIIRDVK
jgi:DNA polymerase elongation subunit (family B)